MQRFEFDFSSRLADPLRLVGIGPGTSYVGIDDRDLDVRFGPWCLRTPLTNVCGAQVTGPYTWVRGIGVRLSFTDRGVTFGTNLARGVCISFYEPVSAAVPFGLLRHPGATVTVTDPDGLLTALERVRLPAS